MNDPIGIALIGCGTVGSGVAKLLLEEPDRFTNRVGHRIDLKRIVVRDVQRPRDVGIPGGLLTTEINEVFNDAGISIVAELMGGTTTARDYSIRVLESGKDLVTANKAVLAAHGDELFRAAREHGRSIAFEAAVGGGIPIISAITQGLAANRLYSIQAILNGTSNYILTGMSRFGRSYEEVLQEAQDAGYAEADPTLDVDGTDAAQKLAILARIAFGAAVPYEKIQRRGIQEIRPADIRYARELGYTIKLVAEAWLQGKELALHVEPTLVRMQAPLALIDGPYNAVHIMGDAVGDTLYYGKGAGQLPTASAVLADVIDLAQGRAQATFRSLLSWSQHQQLDFYDRSKIVSRFYLRVNLPDEPGSLAEVAGILAKEGISIASVVQHEPLEDGDGQPVPVVIMTHEATIGAFQRSLQSIDSLPDVVGPTVYFPVAENIAR